MGDVYTAPERALIEVGRWLGALDYRFTVVTPETHRRVVARGELRIARTVRDVFGWSRPFERALVPAGIVDALMVADVLEERDGLLAARVRFASLGDALYLHSSYPTDAHHAVFFGPDTYRFCAALARSVGETGRVVDVGCGSGAGALSIAARCAQVVLADVNPVAPASAALTRA